MQMKRIMAWLLALSLMLGLSAAWAATDTLMVSAAEYPVTADGHYTSMQEVAVYLETFGRLPNNFVTKKQAQAAGWDNRAGNLDEVAPGKSIGGDYFGNYEGNVPSAKGRQWTEADIDSDGGYRNGLRIVFSNDGLIYYTNDHYASFRQVIVSMDTPAAAETSEVAENGEYTTLEQVAAYLAQYGKLPGNYLTRKQAQEIGWSSKKNNLGDVAPGSAIGGDTFGNREGLLPDAKNRQWYECDVNTVDGKRSKERLVWSNDGLIYYTPDNHKSFERLQ